MIEFSESENYNNSDRTNVRSEEEVDEKVPEKAEFNRRMNNIALYKEQLQPLFDQLAHIAMLGTSGDLTQLGDFVDNPHRFFEKLVTDEKNYVRGILLLAALDGALHGDGKQKTLWAKIAKDLVKDKQASEIDKGKLAVAEAKAEKSNRRRALGEAKEVSCELISAVDEDSTPVKASGPESRDHKLL